LALDDTLTLMVMVALVMMVLDRELLNQLEHLESLDLSNNDLCHSAFPSVKRRSNSFSSPLNAISDPFSMWWDDDDETTTTTASHHHYHAYSADATAAATAAFLASLSLTDPVPMPSPSRPISTYADAHTAEHTAGDYGVTSSATSPQSLSSPPVGSFSTSPFLPPTPPPSPIASFGVSSSASTTATTTTTTTPSTHLPPMLPSLRKLNLRNNNLDRIPRYVCFIASLESLHIELNGLTSLKGVQFLTHLTELNAQMNEIAVRARPLRSCLTRDMLSDCVLVAVIVGQGAAAGGAVIAAHAHAGHEPSDRGRSAQAAPPEPAHHAQAQRQLAGQGVAQAGLVHVVPRHPALVALLVLGRYDAFAVIHIDLSPFAVDVLAALHLGHHAADVVALIVVVIVVVSDVALALFFFVFFFAIVVGHVSLCQPSPEAAS
jgi:hypothetical protein